MKAEANAKSDIQPEFQLIVEALIKEADRLDTNSHNAFNQVSKIKNQSYPECDPEKECDPSCVTESIWKIIRRISKSNSLLESANHNLNTIVGY